MTLHEAIKERKSVRTYTGEAPSSSIMSQIREFAQQVGSVLPNRHARAVVIDREVDGKIGTYGFIRKAAGFVAIVQKGNEALDAVNAGMAGEKLVLQLTTIGIGTCWLGGTFSHGEVARMANPEQDEHIAAIIAYGYAATREYMGARLMASLVGARKRKPFESLFEVDSNCQCHAALESMRLAPSSSNSQPWRVVEQGGDFHFFCVEKRKLNLLDMGIGMFHFAICDSAGKWIIDEGAAALRPDWTYILTRNLK